MRLIDDIKSAKEQTDSYFMQYLMGEDINRLEKLQALAEELIAKGESIDVFAEKGKFMEWTTSDLRTHQIAETLDQLLRFFYRYMQEPNETSEEKLLKAWEIFDADRQDKLLGCL